MNIKNILIVLFIMSLLTACGSPRRQPIDNVAGRPTTYIDPATRGAVSGVGVESQDILSMTDLMMRSIITSGILEGKSKPPRIIMDSKYFENQSSQAINKNLIVDKLRTGLIRSARGRVMFLARESIGMIEQERQLKRECNRL